jgi:hypothetical protein
MIYIYIRTNFDLITNEYSSVNIRAPVLIREKNDEDDRIECKDQCCRTHRITCASIASNTTSNNNENYIYSYCRVQHCCAHLKIYVDHVFRIHRDQSIDSTGVYLVQAIYVFRFIVEYFIDELI